MKDTVTSAKYIHILQHNEIKFNPRIVKLMNDKNKPFEKNDHVFITPHKKVYECLKENKNVVFDNTKAHLINKYADRCDWIIYHGHLSGFYGLKIKRKHLNKIIFRFWGENAGFSCGKGFLKNIVKKFLNYFYIRKISRVAAIGIANKVDEVALREKFPNMQFYRMPYSSGVGIDEIQKICTGYEKKDGEVKVLLGHSGWPADEHIKMLEVLSKYKDRIEIYLPLSYGKAEYIRKVENYVEENCAGYCKIIKDFMPYEEYLKFLNKMDIAILCGKKSYALGNLSLLLFFRKKIFLNNEGIIAATFKQEGIPYWDAQKIGNLGCEEFISPADYPENISTELLPKRREEDIKSWKTLFGKFN